MSLWNGAGSSEPPFTRSGLRYAANQWHKIERHNLVRDLLLQFLRRYTSNPSPLLALSMGSPSPLQTTSESLILFMPSTGAKGTAAVASPLPPLPPTGPNPSPPGQRTAPASFVKDTSVPIWASTLQPAAESSLMSPLVTRPRSPTAPDLRDILPSILRTTTSEPHMPRSIGRQSRSAAIATSPEWTLTTQTASSLLRWMPRDAWELKPLHFWGAF